MEVPVFRMCLIALFGLVGCGEAPEETCDPGPCDEETGLEETGLGEVVGDSERGADVFSGTCSGCHGYDGSGGSAPGLMYAISGNSDEELEAIILEGSGGMPAQNLSAQEVADVIAYLRETYGEHNEGGHR